MTDTATPTAEPGRIRLAVQKSGRLSDDTFELLRQCGLKVRPNKARLFARIEELPIDLLLVRDDDIPELVAQGASDIGIVGGNVFEEVRRGHAGGLAADVVLPLGFSRCRLCIALPKSRDYESVAALKGKRIATSYPALTREWLAERGVNDVEMVEMNGAHEIAPRLGIAEAICDIVSTGATLEANGLRVVETVFQSEALLIGGRSLSAAQTATADALTGRMRGVIRSRHAKYVMMNAPRDAVDRIRDVLPGADAPTVIELAGADDKVALHVVCEEEVLWHHLDAIKQCGASAILVLDIDKMVL
jgi:ATP phosphoribosyltransferase